MQPNPPWTPQQQTLLNRAADFYHQALLKNPEAQRAIAGIGLSDPALLATFRVGYVDGTIRDALPTLRHTCATHMVCNGANVRHVQEMLGHVSLDTTQIYLHLSITDLKEAHARSHPREQEEAYRPTPEGKVLPP
jgi:integrase